MFYNTSDLVSDEIYLKLLSLNRGNAKKFIPPSYNFLIKKIDDKSEIGQCTLRLGHNKYNDYNGNIGYTIYERYRGNGYAQKTCRLLLTLAGKHNMDYVYICCLPGNCASKCICENLGGELQGKFEVPKWHQLFKYNKKEILRYLIKVQRCEDEK